MEVSVGPPTVTIHFDDEVAVCEPSAEMSSTEEQGYFAADTRLVSGYRLKIGGERPVLFNAAAVRDHSARFEFTNRAGIGANGEPLEEHGLHLRLDRTIGHGVHEDYDLTSYARHPVVVELEVSIESDFADLFDVKNHLKGTKCRSRAEIATRSLCICDVAMAGVECSSIWSASLSDCGQSKQKVCDARSGVRYGPMHFGKRWSVVVPRALVWLCGDRAVLVDKAPEHIVTVDVRR